MRAGVGTPKLRLVKLTNHKEGDLAFVIGNVKRQATSHDVKIKLEGAAGVVAPILGKQAPDLHIAVLGGEAPVTLRLQGALEEDGPIWQVELASPIWPSASAGGASTSCRILYERMRRLAHWRAFSATLSFVASCNRFRNERSTPVLS